MPAAREENGFRITVQELAAVVTPATRAVVLNSPANPTGGILSQEDLEGIDEATIANYNLSDRTACTICMNWLVEGIQGTIPAMP